MKTRRETTAEIASDVRKATREKAEADIAEEKALKLELYKEARALEKARKEKLADFYYKLSALLFTGSVISCLTAFVEDGNTLISWQPTLLGLVASICLAIKANITLKH